MKKKRITILLAVCALAAVLCACEKKNDSDITESQVTTTTTKATSLTFASQTAKTTTGETTVTSDTDKTVFTSKDMYHTEQEGKNEVKDFCRFIVRKWAAVYNGGASFDFTPYCKYSELAKYLDYEAKYSEKMMKFSDVQSADLSEIYYWQASNAARYQAIYTTSTSAQGTFNFVVQSVNGRLVLCDMTFDREDSLDTKFRSEQIHLNSSQYWAKQGRFDEIVQKIKRESDKYKLKSQDTLSSDDKALIEEFSQQTADCWARYVGADGNLAIFSYCKYEDLKTYIKMTGFGRGFDEPAVNYFSPDMYDLEISSITINGAVAVVRGDYQYYRKQKVPLVLIVENVGGKLMLNDLVCDIKDSSDNLYRPEFVKDPKPDYWKDASHLADIEKKVNTIS